MRNALPAVAIALGLTVPAAALAAPSPQNGKVVFDKWCAPCHAATPSIYGPMPLPGTMALMTRYGNQRPGVLEQRTDLTPELVKYVVRNGQYGMPITRKTEVSDAELDDVAAYLTRNAAK